MRHVLVWWFVIAAWMSHARRSGVRVAYRYRYATSSTALRDVSGGSTLERLTTTTYKKLTEADAAQTAQVLAGAFSIQEPHSWARALGMPQFLDAAHLADDYVPRRLVSAELGGFGAFIESKMVGALILERHSCPGSWNDDFHPVFLGSNSVFTSYAENSMHALVHRCEAVFHAEFLRRQRGERTAGDALFYSDESRVAFVAWLATDRDARGHGVASALVAEAAGHAQRTGHTHALAFASNPSSARTFAKAGFDKWGEVVYRDFVFAGDAPFRTLPDALEVFVKNLEQQP